jgi:hypothetical protein
MPLVHKHSSTAAVGWYRSWDQLCICMSASIVVDQRRLCNILISCSWDWNVVKLQSLKKRKKNSSTDLLIAWVERDNGSHIWQYIARRVFHNHLLTRYIRSLVVIMDVLISFIIPALSTCMFRTSSHAITYHQTLLYFFVLPGLSLSFHSHNAILPYYHTCIPYTTISLHHTHMLLCYCYCYRTLYVHKPLIPSLWYLIRKS